MDVLVASSSIKLRCMDGVNAANISNLIRGYALVVNALSTLIILSETAKLTSGSGPQPLRGR